MLFNTQVSTLKLLILCWDILETKMIVMNQGLDITNSISFKDLQLKNTQLQSILIWDKEYGEEKT